MGGVVPWGVFVSQWAKRKENLGWAAISCTSVYLTLLEASNFFIAFFSLFLFFSFL